MKADVSIAKTCFSNKPKYYLIINNEYYIRIKRYQYYEFKKYMKEINNKKIGKGRFGLL